MPGALGSDLGAVTCQKAGSASSLVGASSRVITSDDAFDVDGRRLCSGLGRSLDFDVRPNGSIARADLDSCSLPTSPSVIFRCSPLAIRLIGCTKNRGGADSESARRRFRSVSRRDGTGGDAGQDGRSDRESRDIDLVDVGSERGTNHARAHVGEGFQPDPTCLILLSHARVLVIRIQRMDARARASRCHLASLFRDRQSLRDDSRGRERRATRSRDVAAAWRDSRGRSGGEENDSVKE